MTDLRFGIVGVGVMGSNHARVLAELPGIELVGIADADHAQAARVSDALGCKAVSDHKSLLALGLFWSRSRSRRPLPKAARSSRPRAARASS